MNEITRHGKHWVVEVQICTSIRHARFEAIEFYYKNKRDAEIQLARSLKLLTVAKYDIEAERHMRKQCAAEYLKMRASRPRVEQYSLI